MHPLLTTALKIVGPLVGDALGSKRAGKEIMAKVRLRALDVDETEIKAQESILSKELQGDKLQRSWRPHMMYLMGAVIAIDLIVFPVMQILVMPMVVFLLNLVLSTESHVSVPRFPPYSVPKEVWQILLVSIPGYMGLRSVEKVATTMVSGGRAGAVSNDGTSILKRILPGRKKPAPAAPPAQRTYVDVPVEASNDVFEGDIVDIPLQRGD